MLQEQTPNTLAADATTIHKGTTVTAKATVTDKLLEAMLALWHLWTRHETRSRCRSAASSLTRLLRSVSTQYAEANWRYKLLYVLIE